MKKLLKILILGIIVISGTGITSFAQSADSLRIQHDKTEQATKKKADPDMNKQYGNKKNQSINQQMANRNGGNNQGIKQVKGARPDMSKARGARPPSIVRQAGSGMPRGMGKPGGANRHGGR